jgi:hypothetical protein
MRAPKSLLDFFYELNIWPKSEIFWKMKRLLLLTDVCNYENKSFHSNTEIMSELNLSETDISREP